MDNVNILRKALKSKFRVEDGTIIKFTKKVSGLAFNYTAIYIAETGLWYTSSSNKYNNSVFSYEEMMNFLSTCSNVMIATSWEKI